MGKKEELVDLLLAYFIKEGKYNIKVPDNYDDKFKALRGMINVREPLELSNEIIEKENELLQILLSEREVKDVNTFTEKLVIWKGNIINLNCDGIVNACNKFLLGCFIPNHLCIDNDIHTFSGISLRLKCNEIMQGNTLENGKVVLTPAYNLPSKYVIHTVGPQIDGEVNDKDIKELQECYFNSLELARENNLKSIAFPSISTGVFGFPKDKAANISYNVIVEYLKKYSDAFEHIIINVFSDKSRLIYERLFNS